MMPPHITKTSPPDGGELRGNTIEMEGFTLSICDIDDELEVVDEDANAPVNYNSQLKCVWQGPEDGPMGSQQEHCELTITLDTVVPGHVYRLSILGTTIRVTVPATRTL